MSNEIEAMELAFNTTIATMREEHQQDTDRQILEVLDEVHNQMKKERYPKPFGFLGKEVNDTIDIMDGIISEIKQKHGGNKDAK